MQGQVQVIKLHHAVQPRRQLMKQFPQVTVLGNGFGHLEKRLVLRLKERGRYEHSLHREVYRPWGSYDSLESGPRLN